MTGTYIGRGIRDYRLQNGITLAELGYAADLEVKAHDHARSYVALVLDGGFEDRACSRSDWCTPGTVLIRPSGVRHASRYGHRGGRILSIDFPFADPLLGAVMPTEPSASMDPVVRSLMTELLSEFALRDEWSELAITGISLQLAAQCCRTKPDPMRPGWVGSVEARLRDGRSEPNMLELANIARLSPTRFSIEFRRWFGCSPGAYMRKLRLERAMEMVTGTRKSLAEIADILGFSDQSHLSRDFKARYGIRPSACRDLRPK